MNEAERDGLRIFLLPDVHAVWSDLKEALAGTNGYGGDVAEIYAYRVIPPPPSGAPQIGPEIAAEAARNLTWILRRFVELHPGAEIGVEIGRREFRRFDPHAEALEPFDHRIHIEVTSNENAYTSTPIPMLLWCPLCHARHIDEGEFATRSHSSHACQSCGLTWKPAIVPTVGVMFLPGYANTNTIDEPVGSLLQSHNEAFHRGNQEMFQTTIGTLTTVAETLREENALLRTKLAAAGLGVVTEKRAEATGADEEIAKIVQSMNKAGMMCGCDVGSHPPHRNLLEGGAERDGRICSLGWSVR